MKKLVFSVMLALILISTLTLTFNIKYVKADYVWRRTIYIRVNGNVEPSDAPILRVGDVYTLTDNIIEAAPSKDESAIIIQRDNIIFDGAGHKIQGKGIYASKGINLSGRSNVTIQNVNIEYFDYGIWLWYSSNNRISGNNIKNNSVGIGITDSSNNRIFGNSITNNNEAGIWLRYSSNNSIFRNNVINNAHGIFLNSSLNNGVSENNITNNSAGVWLEYSYYNSIFGNSITNSNYHGIGIGIVDSSNNSIFGNNVTNNCLGIGIQDSFNNGVSENNITNNEAGIWLWYSSNNRISGNNIKNNSFGIGITDSSNNRIFGNSITNNNEAGICLVSWSTYSSNNSIFRNNITNNYDGIQLKSSLNNKFWHNNIIKNTLQVHDYAWDDPKIPPSFNVWDDGYPSGGNYWSDYGGVDVKKGPNQDEPGSDGIGDTPHRIDWYNVDRYPLIYPVSLGDVIVVVYDWDGVGAALAGGDTWVELVRHGEVSGVTRHIDEYSRAIFYGVEPGTYYVNVWHRPVESVSWQEFWAQKTGIVVEEAKPVTVEVKRHFPVITGFEVQQVPAKIGEASSITLTIKNIDSADQWVKARLIVKHESGEWVYENESSSRKLEPEQETAFTFSDFTPDKEGSYYGYAICNIVGGGSQTTDQEGWKYLFSISLVENILLNFSVYYEGKLYKVSLEVPYLRFSETVGQIGNDYYSWYPKIDPSVLRQAYYLERHVRNPDGYPILKVAVYHDGQQVFQEDIKVKILSELLNYCLELFGAAHPAKLDTYLTYSEDWYRAYRNIAFWVQLSNHVSKILDWATIIGPIIGSIKDLYGATTSEQVKTVISLYFDILSGYDALKEKYGGEKADTIVNMLIQHNLCASKDYNPLEVYAKFEASPSITLDVLEAISSEALNLELNSNAKTLIRNFLEELEEGAIGEFAANAALSLYAYFGSGLTAKTAAEIGLSSAFKGFIKYVIPLALARAIMKGYILPMAEAINSAWESMGYIANSFAKMYVYGVRISNPKNNVFNLTDSRIFASQLGLEYLSEYNYYVKTYFYRSRQILKSQSELDYYRVMAQTALSYAQKWAKTLSNIQHMATAIIQASDPEGETFEFELIPPPELNPYPEIPENSKGFIVQINAPTNITLQSGEYILIVQNGEWYSNFTYPLYIDDAYGTQYLIIFNPPNQSYTVQTNNETIIKLENFEISNGNITTSTAGEITGTEAEFKVSFLQIDPTTVIPEYPQNLIQLIIIIATLGTTVLLRKKAKINT